MTGKEYQVYGYKGKQVRDQIHSHDVANLFMEFYKSPRCGEVYNMGGGRQNSISILETIDLLAAMGYNLKHSYKPDNRIGDHICYISDLSKISPALPQVEAGIRSAAHHRRDRCRPYPGPRPRGDAVRIAGRLGRTAIP